MAEIKRYSKTELAMLYFPDSTPDTARKHLMGWINSNKELTTALKQAGYQPHDRILKKRFVKLIFEYLDDP